MTQLPLTEIQPVISSAVSEVFQTMLGLPFEIGEAREEAMNHPQKDGIVALVSIGGGWTGSGRLSCSADLACRMASGMLLGNYQHVSDEVLDAMAEIANMVIGSAKTVFEDRLGALVLGIPTVVYGRNYQTRCSGAPRWTAVPVKCGGEVLEVCFFMMKQSTPAGVPARELVA